MRFQELTPEQYNGVQDHLWFREVNIIVGVDHGSYYKLYIKQEDPMRLGNHHFYSKHEAMEFIAKEHPEAVKEGVGNRS